MQNITSGTIPNKLELSHQSIIDKLIQLGIITEDQLQIAAEELNDSQDTSIMQALIRLNLVTEEALMSIMVTNEEQAIDLDIRILNQDIVHKIAHNIAIQHKLILIDESETTVTVAIEDITNIMALDIVKKTVHKTVIPLYSSESSIMAAIDRYYQHSFKIADIIAEIESEEDNKLFDEYSLYKDPIVRLTDAIIGDAFRSNASDIHVEPNQHFVRIRYRIDGMLINRVSFHNKYWDRFLCRLKIIASMNIAEKHKPQDGSISTIINGSELRLRASSIPTAYGENIVLRLLNVEESIVSLQELGFSDTNIACITMAMSRPEGIILSTGPTGSGKTTTLYSMISMLNKIDVNIMTLEDPIEYALPMIRQTSINYRAGLDFASGLRAILRQDPDIILIGEIRDNETAKIGIQSAMTGHIVFSTLHANDAISTITRLLDIGIPYSLISSSINAIIGQRLVRMLCKHCKIAKKPTELFHKIASQNINIPDAEYNIYDAVGCDKCFNTGYSGRTIVSEAIFFSKDMINLISSQGTNDDIMTLARKNGFISMAEDGLYKVMDGIISINELRAHVDMVSILGLHKNSDLLH